jgi:hypothetical protein
MDKPMYCSDMQTKPTGNEAELAQSARDIMTAWVRRDKVRLLGELERNLECAEIQGPDSERYQLLSVIATRMSMGSALAAAADSDPEVCACLGLLAHFMTECRAAD